MMTRNAHLLLLATLHPQSFARANEQQNNIGVASLESDAHHVNSGRTCENFVSIYTKSRPSAYLFTSPLCLFHSRVPFVRPGMSFQQDDGQCDEDTGICRPGTDEGGLQLLKIYLKEGDLKLTIFCVSCS